ncbi:MAG: hypothetical protein ABSA97_06690, partial [Verrucomicrobiia bacterium]
MTLGILALVTLLLIAFVTRMRVENMAAKNFNDMIKARQLAQAAVDQAVAQLRSATTRSATILNYVTFPGVVYDYNGSTTTRVPLYSVNASDTFDLNFTANNIYWITDNTGEFPGTGNGVINVGWIYVGQNPSIAPGPANPLIGRFAFWVDDEASKININTAGVPGSSPSPDYGYSVPNEVDLSASSVLLSNLSTYASFIVNRRTAPNPPYATIQEIRRANTGIINSDVAANRFSMTAYSDDASGGPVELDAQGVPRRVLSELTENDDIKNTPAASSNAFARLSDLNTTLSAVYNSAGTFETKYTQNGLKQIIANIIAIFVFTMPAGMSVRASLLGVVAGFFPIGWIVLNV